MKLNGSWLLSALLAVTFMFSGLCVAQTQGGIQGQGGSQAQGSESGQEPWFSVESLNEGLGEVPEGLERGTPREAIRNFLELTEQNKYAAAAHVINLSGLPPEEQQERGPELARQLAEVLQRGEWLNVSSLSGRQDAAIMSPTSQNPLAGKPRRNIQLASLTADGEAYDVRLGRYRVGDADPVWLIMPDIVSSIPALYEQYGPSLLEEYIPERFKASFGPLRIWEWIAIPIVLLAIGLLGWGIYSLVGLIADRLPYGSPSIFARRIRGPLALIVMSLVTQALLDYVVSFSAVITTSFRVLLIAILAWGAGAVALRLIDTIMLRMTRRLVGQIDDTKPKDERKLLTSLYALRRVIILIMVTAVSIYVLSQIQIFESLGLSLLASASVLTVLIGIAGQAVLGNIISSFQVSLAKPIRIGDLVMFEGQWCYVEGIFYTFIRLRVWNERRLIVPVTYFVSRPFENFSVKSAKEYRSLEMILHLSADIECIREKFIEYAKEEDSVIEHHKLLCYVTGQTGTALTVTCYLMTTDPMSGWGAEMNVREKLLAFVRDNYPEWWPREVVVISHQDIARGESATTRMNGTESGAEESASESE
ncbi:mechanosensitive ion channel family protein [Halomonas sp. McH1-25]|uniref:mechanosensitive ion channel family protein n=1 Tax=unclassified Halomonas TaxID=2609666 RepID=UPI001EF3DC3C|nr:MULTISPECIES: mechanosensitive ion channel domain-containing protein [unclassified Halomonas]MCG7600804.1 mechanosensitive ion channel family protein [Halomonas sp. McH1-25]MCP1342769.1 mechanosensitive ion channel family protein [Halomonas sp. FL8]MCP1362857.1 mechanosensitive ion channel family protein [Halomonas sp. BBD45]MCP1365580.1 mechanosensitive ion channel family protein [Halomonas sp. BBD48]